MMFPMFANNAVDGRSDDSGAELLRHGVYIHVCRQVLEQGVGAALEKTEDVHLWLHGWVLAVPPALIWPRTWIMQQHFDLASSGHEYAAGECTTAGDACVVLSRCLL